ncbi:MAG: PHP domain-containing protein, partial [Pyrinomonadaceae bacterium]
MAEKPERPQFGAKDFVHLHLHTDYSLLQSTIQLKHLAKRLNELDQKACAITDYGNMYGAVSFFNTMNASGIQPVVGYEAFLKPGSRFDRSAAVEAGEKGYYSLILLAQNLEGYQNLVHLSSKAFTEGFLHKPLIDMELLGERNAGLICLSGGKDGTVGHFLASGDEDKALARANGIKEIFGSERFFLEIQDHSDERGKKLTNDTVSLSKKGGFQIVATNDVHYLNKDDERAQQLLICIGEGRTIGENSHDTTESIRYLRSAEEMWNI